MNDPDDLDKDTARSSWLATVKIFIPNLINHDDPDAEPDPATVAMGLIEEDNGFAGFCEWPSHYRILNMIPYSKAAWEDAHHTRIARDQIAVRVFMQKVKERLGDASIDTPELWQVMEDEYHKMNFQVRR